MEEKERNSSQKIEFIRENYKKQTLRDGFREGSITGSIYEALLSIKAEINSLNIAMVLLEEDLHDLKEELNQ